VGCADGLYISLAPHSNRFIHEICVGLYSLWFDSGSLFLLDPFIGKVFESKRVVPNFVKEEAEII
jgi:hypothetical protein